MDNIKKDIEKRTQEYDEDKFKLPESCRGDQENPRLSRRGHRWIIDDLKTDLMVYEIIYGIFCNPPTPQMPRIPRLVPPPPLTPQQRAALIEAAGSAAALWWLWVLAF
jgi:hypothetical protein